MRKSYTGGEPTLGQLKKRGDRQEQSRAKRGLDPYRKPTRRQHTVNTTAATAARSPWRTWTGGGGASRRKRRSLWSRALPTVTPARQMFRQRRTTKNSGHQREVDSGSPRPGRQRRSEPGRRVPLHRQRPEPWPPAITRLLFVAATLLNIYKNRTSP